MKHIDWKALLKAIGSTAAFLFVILAISVIFWLIVKYLGLNGLFGVVFALGIISIVCSFYRLYKK